MHNKPFKQLLHTYGIPQGLTLRRSVRRLMGRYVYLSLEII